MHDKLISKVKSYDVFATGLPPFSMNGKGKATTFLGGLCGFGIKIVSTALIIKKLNEMIFFSNPKVSQLTIQGTPIELSTIYGEKELGNTSFAVSFNAMGSSRVEEET